MMSQFPYNTRFVGATLDAPASTAPIPLTAVDYATNLLNNMSNPSAIKAPQYVSTSEFSPAQASGGGFMYSYPTSQIVFLNAGYTAANAATSSVGSLALTKDAMTRLAISVKTHAPADHFFALMDVESIVPALSTGWEIIIVGALLIATAFALGTLAPLTLLAALTLWGSTSVLAATFGIGLLLIVVGAVDLQIEPTPSGSPIHTPNGATCQYYTSPLGGCTLNCVAADGTPSSTPCGGGLGGPLGSVGTGLESAALGLGLIVLVGLGGYVGYKIVTGRKITQPTASAASGKPGIVERVGHGAVSGVEKVGGAMKRIVAKAARPKANPARTHMYSAKGMYGGRRR